VEDRPVSGGLIYVRDMYFAEGKEDMAEKRKADGIGCREVSPSERSRARNEVGGYDIRTYTST
jgi:hypothetical protein